VVAYLDNAATTPMRPEAVAAMKPWMGDRFGNPSGSHSLARAARCALDEARDLVAEVLAVEPGGVVFTSGGTESDNLAVLGAVLARPGAVVYSAIEHDAVRGAAAAAATLTGSELRVVPVDGNGRIDLDRFAEACDKSVRVVSVMAANNEVGTIQPLAELARIARRRCPGAVLHTDAVQGLPWMDLASAAADFDAISVSAHKCGGPQGVGVLALRGNPALSPVLHGGPQERERRPGTHNVAGIVGTAAALQVTSLTRGRTVAVVAGLRDRLAEGLLAEVPGAVETVGRADKVAGNCHFCFPGVETEALLVLLDDEGVCASAGSACSSGAVEPSHVLAAMGLSPQLAAGRLRLSLGWASTNDDVDLAVKVIGEAVWQLRNTR
jgi:cysteine desulfurase